MCIHVCRYRHISPYIGYGPSRHRCVGLYRLVLTDRRMGIFRWRYTATETSLARYAHKMFAINQLPLIRRHNPSVGVPLLAMLSQRLWVVLGGYSAGTRRGTQRVLGGTPPTPPHRTPYRADRRGREPAMTPDRSRRPSSSARSAPPATAAGCVALATTGTQPRNPEPRTAIH